MFKLNKCLENDTFPISETSDYTLLLHKNALVPWLILVPKTQEFELFNCDIELKKTIIETIDYLAKTSQDYFNAEKMNIATIGNIVSQLHIHIIARKSDDFCWPDPVWGKTDHLGYDDVAKKTIIKDIQECLSKKP